MCEERRVKFSKTDKTDKGVSGRMKKGRVILAALLAGCLAWTGGLGHMFSQQASAAADDRTRVSVHDPSIMTLEDGSYYMIGSHLGAGRSNDLIQWTDTANSVAGTVNTTYFADIYTDLAIPATWSDTSEGYDLSGNLWAPDILWNPEMEKYCMYLSVNGNDWHSSIVLCTADNVDGPYTYAGTIVYSGFETNPADPANHYQNTDVELVLGELPDLSRYLTSSGRWNAEYGTNAIDPCVFYDEAGSLWMAYGSWFGGIYMLELDEQTGLRDYTVEYDLTLDYSDPYMGIHIAGGHWASGEGAYIEYMTPPGSSKGYYYLFLSYGYFHPNGGYQMRVFRSEYPAGPYTDEKGNSPIYFQGADNINGDIGMRLMSNYQWSCNSYSYKAQGHNSALMDKDGKLYVVYHTKFGTLGLFHQVRVHQLIMNEDGWITAAPYEYSGESLSENGHTMAAMAGEYEYIFHAQNQGYRAEWSDSENNDTVVDIAKPVRIQLHPDGTVTGAATGTWSVTSGTPYMQLTLDGVTYKGAFLVQEDESAEGIQRMTFTATGENLCVWGSKTTAYTVAEDLTEKETSSQLVYQTPVEPQTNYVGEPIQIGETRLFSGVSYTIVSRFSGKALDLTDGSTADGTNIQQWTLTGGSHQEWRVRAETDGYCSIRSMADERKAITIRDGNVELVLYTGADTQLFQLVQERGSYGILSKASNATTGLDVFEWSTENGGNISEYEYWGGDCQLWNFTPVQPAVSDGTYVIRSALSGLLLNAAVDTNGGIAHQDRVDQVWKVTKLLNGFCTIQDAKGMALTIQDGSGADGQDVVLTPYTGERDQQFRFHANADGTYAILTAVSEEASGLDVYGISLEAGAKICQWNYWAGTGQKFVLLPAVEPSTEEPSSVLGDVNADGACDAADAVALQKWLLGVGTLVNGKAGDLLADGRLNALDLAMLRAQLLA